MSGEEHENNKKAPERVQGAASRQEVRQLKAGKGLCAERGRRL